MKIRKEIIATAALIGIAGVTAIAAANADEPLETVRYVDLKSYLGTWYEIASFPQIFERGCTHIKADYSINTDGSIRVENSCIKDGKPKTTVGKAIITDKQTNAKLSVQFFWPFKGKYWIIALAHDYSYAVVGHPNRKYLWILGRKPEMDSQTYNHLVVQIAAKGFDVRNLIKSDQG